MFINLPEIPKGMLKKGVLDLPVNMLVVIIISIVILTSGMALLFQFIEGAENIKVDLDLRTKEELQRLLVEQGKQVALPLHEAIVPRGESHVFGLGILNSGSNGEEEFHLTLELAKVTDDFNHDITAEVDRNEVKDWLLYDKDPLVITENDHREEPILVHVDKNAVKGTYLFHVRVLLANQQQYGNLQTFIVTVV